MYYKTGKIHKKQKFDTNMKVREIEEKQEVIYLTGMAVQGVDSALKKQTLLRRVYKE